jgi:phosphate starvation-inducible membrane PsiE
MKSVQDVDRFGNILVGIFHRLALFAIGAATAWAAGVTFLEMFQKHHATIQDLLLMFIYLELGAMVGIYFKTNHMPVRFLLYIAITALTRHMIDILSHVPLNINEMLAIGATTIVMALSVLIIRYTSARFPSDRKDDVV